MRTWKRDQIIANLQREGLVFSDFSLVHEGDYAVDDADWNYKDVPHLHHVHQLVEAIFTMMDDTLIGTINVQKVFGLKFPMCLMNYQSGKNEQTYYTSWLFFVLLVRTSYEALGPNKTRVTTNYSIGSPKLLKWFVPLIRFAIKRNYKDLMSTDIPMRERRGQLRSWGYSFYKDSESYSFPKTMEILRSNVIAPSSAQPKKLTVAINEVLPQEGEYLYGRDDHLGLRLVRKENQLHLFPRMCPHEGASLDQGQCVNLKVKCPWHGRLHAPLASFKLEDDGLQEVKTDKFIFTFSGKTLTAMEVKKISSAVEA